MKVRIADYYTMDWREEEIGDLTEWIKGHRIPVLVHPPNVNRPNTWLILTSFDGRFTQR